MKRRRLNSAQVKELRTLRLRDNVPFVHLGARYGISGAAAFNICRGYNSRGGLYTEPEAQPDEPGDTK